MHGIMSRKCLTRSAPYVVMSCLGKRGKRTTDSSKGAQPREIFKILIRGAKPPSTTRLVTTRKRQDLFDCVF